MKNFNSSTVNDGLNFTEFTLDMHAIKELNCILDHAYIEHLPLRIKDNDQHEVSATATAIATAKIGSKE